MTVLSGPTCARVSGSRVRAVRVFPGVVCMRCIWYFSFNYHQKWARIHNACKVTGVRQYDYAYLMSKRLSVIYLSHGVFMLVSQWRVPEQGHTWVENAPGEWWLTDGLPHHPPQYRAYAPLVDCTGLFLIFAGTAPKPEGIMTFANDYGLLGLRSRGVIQGTAEGIEHWGEAREDWLKAILTMRHTVTLWDWAQKRDRESLSRQVYWDERSLAWIDTHPAFSEQEKQSDGAYAIDHTEHAYLPAGFLHHMHYEGTELPQLHVRERVTHPGALLFPVGDVVSVALAY